MSEDIKFPDDWWTAGAVKAWEWNVGTRWRLLPCGRIDKWNEGVGWGPTNYEVVDLQRERVYKPVECLPIPDWAADYDRAAERIDGCKAREKDGKCENWWPSEQKWIRDPINCVASYFDSRLAYTPVPTVLGGWPAPAPTPPVAEPELETILCIGGPKDGKRIAPFKVYRTLGETGQYEWRTYHNNGKPLNVQVWVPDAPPAPPQSDPDRLILEQIVWLLADLKDALNGNGTDGELTDTLNSRVPAIVAALRGRRP